MVYLVCLPSLSHQTIKRKNIIKIWRTDAERMSSDCLLESRTGDGGKVCFWGCITAFGTGSKQLFNGLMNSNRYKEVLFSELGSCKDLYPQQTSWIFQHDNAP